MTKMINFGIDLGTSNSLIAKFDKGQVEVFKNPNGFKETLPSIVGFRNDRTLVGEQARSYAERDSKSVASRFKRKMGTTETFKIKAINQSKSPIELSSYVLKELKTFVHSGEAVEAAVITIPASFDTVQSNATKQAGEIAGFKTVILLQEPIAASLAYANKERGIDLRNSQWIVYDLGGGTFDVALVRIIEGELTVVDHEGDNYLGGGDFDSLLVEKVIVPELMRRGHFDSLWDDLRSESGKYNKLWYRLLNKAEEAKIELSMKSSAEVDLGSVRDLEDDNGKVIDSILTITRSDFDAVIRESIDGTTEMMKRILVRNSLSPTDLQFILMVGGSTYIPYVRKRVEEVMSIPVNTSIDPTNAIAVGAAYFAGTKQLQIAAAPQAQGARPTLKIRPAYNRNSQDAEETFVAKVEGQTAGLHYRITSEDGAFDSGLKPMSGRITEDLPLRNGAFNLFSFKVVDAQGSIVNTDLTSIQIAQGRYSVAGQMLPEDISVVKDDLAARDTRLDVLFSKNTVLPTRAKKTFEVGKTIVKGSADELRIMVVEGPSDRHSSTNKPIGVLFVTGTEISRDLIRGTEVELTFEMSESRDLSVSAFLSGTGQEFSQVFKPSARDVSTKILAQEVLMLEEKLQTESDDAASKSQNDVADGLNKLVTEVQKLISESSILASDDVTDEKFKLEDRKRRIAQAMYDLTSSKRLEQTRADYRTAREEVAALVNEDGNDRERHIIGEIIAREAATLQSNNPEKIALLISQLDTIRYTILWRTPAFLKSMFEHLDQSRVSMNDQIVAKQLLDSGRRAISESNWDEVSKINSRLFTLLPEKERNAEEMRAFTNLV